MKVLFFLSIICSLIFLACEQDPLIGEDERIRNGIPLSEKPRDYRDLIAPESLVFGFSNQNLNFFEGEESEYVLQARTIGFEDPTLEVEFSNLPQGAVYDPATKTLRWKPPFDTVVGSDNFRTVSFVGRMFVKNRAAVKQKTFQAWVFRTEGQPVIEKIEFSGEKHREGQIVSFVVKVRDKTSFDSLNSRGRRPMLQPIMANNSWRKGAGLAQIQSVTRFKDDPEVWLFRGNVRTNTDIINKKETLSIAFMAFSAFGQASEVKSANFLLQNQVENPVISWLPEQVWGVHAGTTGEVHFSIFDPKMEGLVSAYGFRNNCNSINRKNGTLKCQCTRSKIQGHQADSHLICRLQWTPARAGKLRTIKFIVLNSNKESHADVRRITGSIKIQALPPLPPPPSEPPVGEKSSKDETSGEEGQKEPSQEEVDVDEKPSFFNFFRTIRRPS